MGRPRVGARISVRLREAQLAQLDDIVERRRADEEVSPSTATRAAVLRDLVDRALGGQPVVGSACPEPADDRSRTAPSRQANGGPQTLRDPDADRDPKRHPYR